MKGAFTLRDFYVELLAEGKTLRVPAFGHSMWPLMRDGNILEVAPADSAEIKAGDVIVFKDSGGRFVAHRLMGRVTVGGKKKFLAGRDFGLKPDAPISEADIAGKVVSVEAEGEGKAAAVGLELAKPLLLTAIKIKNFIILAAYKRGLVKSR